MAGQAPSLNQTFQHDHDSIFLVYDIHVLSLVKYNLYFKFSFIPHMLLHLLSNREKLTLA